MTSERLTKAADDLLSGVSASIDEVKAEARKHLPALLGTATVSLHLEIDNAVHPVDAVNQALTELALNGLRGYTFLVRDEVTQELYAVTNGQMVTLKPEED